jgi:hypothetical protein
MIDVNDLKELEQGVHQETIRRIVIHIFKSKADALSK